MHRHGAAAPAVVMGIDGSRTSVDAAMWAVGGPPGYAAMRKAGCSVLVCHSRSVL